MGKNGQLMREKKKQTARLYTDEQIEEIRVEARRSQSELLKADLNKMLDEHEKNLREQIDKEWEQKYREFQSGVSEDDRLSYLRCTLAIPLKVLIERFGWKPMYGDRWDKLSKTYKFMFAMMDEINEIGKDKTKDITTVADEVLNKYGVGYRTIMEGFK